MIIKGDDIKQLIPQRAPFMMVDEFEQQDENTAKTSLTSAGVIISCCLTV